MDFGYFTLSDNHYRDNPRSPNQFIADITAEALHAETLGMHSAWIGEHHFNALGVLSCPDLVLSLHRRAHQPHPACARRHRAAAASSDPRRRAMGDARSAQSGGRVDFAAGRGYDRREYEPFDVSFDDNQGDLRGGHGTRAETVERRRPHRPRRQALFRSRTCASRRSRCRSRCRPMSPRSPSRRSNSPPGWNCGLIVAPFAAAMSFGGLKQVADLYHETCAKYGTKPQRLMCSYFTHFADDAASRNRRSARARSAITRNA